MVCLRAVDIAGQCPLTHLPSIGTTVGTSGTGTGVTLDNERTTSLYGEHLTNTDNGFTSFPSIEKKNERKADQCAPGSSWQHYRTAMIVSKFWRGACMERFCFEGRCQRRIIDEREGEVREKGLF